MAKPVITKAQPIHGPVRVPWAWQWPLESRGSYMSLSRKVLFTRSNGGGRWTRLPVQETLFEVEIKVQMPKAACAQQLLGCSPCCVGAQDM